jgi:VIT1/CCC1 family predicted Fe2+/Mn2+ transporter
MADAADHVVEARQRARQVLSGESHLGAVDDWRRALGSARDALILVWLTWVSLHGFGDPPFTGFMLVAFSIGLALLMGISTGRATHTQVQYYAAELDRERAEIRDDFEHEQEEVRTLYAAKGFREPLLTQVVDTLCADDDRLLKVMMEEELGLALHHVNHPIVVGAWNFAASAIAGLVLALPVSLGSRDFAHWWMPTAGGTALAMLSTISWRATGRSVIEFFAVGVFMGVVTGGVVYFLSQWLAQRLAEATA